MNVTSITTQAWSTGDRVRILKGPSAGAEGEVKSTHYDWASERLSIKVQFDGEEAATWWDEDDVVRAEPKAVVA